MKGAVPSPTRVLLPGWRQTKPCPGWQRIPGCPRDTDGCYSGSRAVAMRPPSHCLPSAAPLKAQNASTVGSTAERSAHPPSDPLSKEELFKALHRTAPSARRGTLSTSHSSRACCRQGRAPCRALVRGGPAHSCTSRMTSAYPPLPGDVMASANPQCQVICCHWDDKKRSRAGPIPAHLPSPNPREAG